MLRCPGQPGDERNERSVHRVGVDGVPGDVVAEARLRRDVDEALVVHRIDGRVEPGRQLVPVNELVQQATLVVEAGADPGRLGRPALG
jgi:hypothetical protein